MFEELPKRYARAIAHRYLALGSTEKKQVSQRILGESGWNHKQTLEEVLRRFLVYLGDADV